MNGMTTKDLRCIRWPLFNPDTGLLNATHLIWKEVATAIDQYDFSVAEQAFDLARQIGRTVMLRIEADPPIWSKRPVQDYIAFIKALGNAFNSHPLLFSMDMTLPESEYNMDDTDLAAVADAYIHAFPRAYKLFDVSFGRLAAYLQGRSDVGLILDVRNEDSDIGDQLAKHGLQRVWETAPVIMIANNVGEALMRDAIRWHVSILDTCGKYEETSLARIGYRIELRRVVFATSALPLQNVPLSVWVINNGNAPCYNKSCFQLRLLQADGNHEMVAKTTFTAGALYPGEDQVLSENVLIDGIPEGVYDVELGLFEENTGFPVSMAIEGRISDGFYAALIQLTVG